MDKKYLTNRSQLLSTQAVENGRKTENGKNGRGNGGRRKEYKSENTKQLAPQKSKAFADKRPKSRRFGFDWSKEEIGEKDDYVCTNERPRKVNLAHLLNFSYGPRGGGDNVRSGRRVYSNRVKFNKEQFLQANCQFVVKAGPDYSIHFDDPDTLVNWDLVELINISMSEQPSCPICLYPPKPAKMTRCGHIYCWPCILHYLSLEDQHWRKCPICYEAIHQEHLKSVKTEIVKDYHAGDTIRMQLMKKMKGTTLISPVNRPDPPPDSAAEVFVLERDATAGGCGVLERDATAGENGILERDTTAGENGVLERDASAGECSVTPSASMCASAGVDSVECGGSVRDKRLYQKLVLVTNDEVREMIVQPEKEMLIELSCSEPEASEVCFIESALALLADRERSLDSCQSKKVAGTTPPLSVFDENSHVSVGDGKQWFYFYQADDGQQIYLNSMNARCLITEYGCLEDGPRTITAEVLEVEHHVMSKDLRKRLRYLSHVPVTCEFRAVELLLTPPVLSQSTLDIFHEDIERRRRQRQRKTRDESRHQRRVQRDEDRKQGIYPAMQVKIDSRRQFPEYTPFPDEQDSGRSSPASIATTASTHNTPYGSPRVDPFGAYSVGGESLEHHLQTGVDIQQPVSPSGPSFAEMLKDGKAMSRQWPSLPSSPPANPTYTPITPDSDRDETTPIPSFQASFGDAFQVALENFNLNESRSGSKKKKKPKKQVLFTTSLNRSLGN